jgi:hypothetical protein
MPLDRPSLFQSGGKMRNGVQILVVRDEFGPDEKLLQLLEGEGYDVSGTFGLEQAEQFLESSYDTTPDIIVFSVGARFDRLLKFAESNWVRRASRNNAVRPQMVAIALNDTLWHLENAFGRAGCILVPNALESVRFGIKKARATLAELTLGKPYCLQIHDNAGNSEFCRPGEHVLALTLAPSNPKGELIASGRLRTFLGAFMTMNGTFHSRAEIHWLLNRHPLYTNSRFEVPGIATIKTYLDEDCPQAFERAFNALKMSFDPKKIVEKQWRIGNEVGYRLRVKWQIRHVQKHSFYLCSM